MAKEEDLSKFAAFDLDDLISEIESKNTNKKEVTAYLDRSFIINTINEYYAQTKVNKPDFTVDNVIDFSEYNFTGADLRGIKRKDFELFNFKDCDISSARLDRVGLDFFIEYMLNGQLTFQNLNLENTYLGPTLTRRIELGIECYVYLNLSNINFTATNFSNSDIDGLVLENTNISSCNFVNAKNLDLKQFAFSIGFETAIFDNDPIKNQEIRKRIAEFSESLNPKDYYAHTSQKSNNKFIAYLAQMTNILDD